MAAAVVERVTRADSTQNTKQELLTKVVNLESRIQSLEREKNAHLFNKRNEFRAVFCGLEETDLKFTLDRRNEKQELKQSVERIRTSVTAFKRMLTDMRPGPTFVEALKKAMEDIEASIAAFKEKQRIIYEELLQEEKTVDIEVSAFEKKLESWMAAKTSQGTHTANSATVSTRGAQPTPSSIPPAVMAFERFMQQTGGRQGGWDEYDHQTFLKIRTKFNGHPSYIEAAGSELPTKTMEEISEHDQWYSEYCTLLESKKNAIDTWKKQKQTTRTNQITSTVNQQSKIDTKTKSSSREELLATEREERFKKLTEWKARQDAQHKEEELKRLKAETERSKKAEKDRRRRAVLKAQVQEYTRDRDHAHQVEKQREETEKAEEMERRRVATKEVERFRERDFKEIRLRKEKEKMKEAEIQERMKALEKIKQTVEVKVDHDPNRLFKLTAGWEERKKAGVGSGIGGSVLSLPKRAVPSWRQGL